MKKQLTKKLAAYSGITSALLLVAQHGHSQIIYTEIPDVDVNPYNAYYGLDLNNDGIVDFSFGYFGHNS